MFTVGQPIVELASQGGLIVNSWPGMYPAGVRIANVHAGGSFEEKTRFAGTGVEAFFIGAVAGLRKNQQQPLVSASAYTKRSING